MATLDATDVVIWWGHQKQREVKDEFAERVAQIPATECATAQKR